MVVLATGLAVLGALGAIEDAAGKACWLALVGGLIVAVPTAATGFADWVRLDWGSARWRTATLHLTAMLTAVVLFALAAWLQHRGYEHGDVTTGGLVAFALLAVVALLGFSMLALWLRQRSRRPAAAGARGVANGATPAEQRFPTPVVGLHGVLGAATLVVVLLVAAGVGGS
jgi:hypothetical protein